MTSPPAPGDKAGISTDRTAAPEGERSGIRCPSCGHDNRERARFCDGCGAALAGACPGCGTELRAAARFCDGCGRPVAAPPAPARDPRAYTPGHLVERILTSRAALEGERKQVTVLFADVKGSLALAEQVDPEAWHGIMDRFFQLLADGVHRFEGTVNQYTGDGIMALFGAPIAHEDHAQRACWAALALRDALRPYARELKREHGFDFVVRMGINSGEVVVGRIGDDLRMEYTAQGHTVGLAARMQELASADSAYVTGTTAALVSGYFDLEDLGRFNVKGVREPVPIFELRGAGALRTRLDVSRARGLARFVGRDGDLRTLEAALGGNGQVVGVIGEAGVGKSRLCFEFVERCRARGLMVLEGRAVAHGRNVPLVPILQVFRAYFGITEPDVDRTAREKIAGRMLLLDESFREALPVVFEFLGVPDPERPAPRMDPEARQRQLFGVLRQLIQGGDQRDPVVTLIEDLHWLDPASEAWIEQWVDAVPGTRRLLVVNFRPEYRAGWMQQSHFHQIPLLPLGPEAIRELLADLLGQDPSTAGLAEAIHRRTAGNPFFTEEVVQALVEAGNLQGSRGNYRLVTPVEKLEVPGTVQSLLAARIDRLPEREKRLLQTAAVIGRELSEPVLAAVAELPGTELAQALAKLRSAEFLYEQALYPVAEYAFKHPLTQEVAYRSQLGERRARVHAAVARAIAALHPEKLDERAALLAHHWESAGEALEAARWHRRAADWVGTSDPATASGHCQKVRTLLDGAPESAETLALGLMARIRLLDFGWRLGIDEEEAARLLAEGKDIAGRSGDVALLARLVSIYGTVRGTTGAVQEYLECALEAERLAEQTDDAELKFLLQMPVYARYLVGHLDEALERCDASLALLDERPGLGAAVGPTVDPAVFLAWFRAVVLLDMGRIADTATALDRATEMARERRALEVLGWVHFTHTWLAEATGRVEGALQHAHQSLEIAEKMGSTFSRVTALRAVAVAHLLRSEWDDAVRLLEEALQVMRERRTGMEGEGVTLVLLAEAHLGRGEVAAARGTAEEAVAVAHRRAIPAQEIRGQLALARVLRHADGPRARSAIEAALDRARALVEETGARLYAPRIHCELAELARLVGDETGRRRELAQAERLFAAMGATHHAEQTARALAG